MRRRCNNPKDPAYQRYGGRGIHVCERWLVFASFLEDMGPRPLGTTLDRIDGNRGYEPGNCRWATIEVQNRNRSNCPFSDDDVQEIRGRIEMGETHEAIAIRFNAHIKTINGISRSISWKDLPPIDPTAMAAVTRRRQQARDAIFLSEISDRVARGQPTRAMASDLGISRERIRNIVRRGSV